MFPFTRLLGVVNCIGIAAVHRGPQPFARSAPGRGRPTRREIPARSAGGPRPGPGPAARGARGERFVGGAEAADSAGPGR